MGYAIRIDIETELKAIEAGECGGCRVGITHKATDRCAGTPLRERWKMQDCDRCGESYAGVNFSGCPICHDPDKVRK